MAKVLLVDDNKTYRKAVSMVLGDEGHVVIEAGDGAEAFELARRELPQLVISDIVMPSMDGYAFVRQLRGDPQLADTKVVFHTAHFGNREAHELAGRCQVEHMLAKPCDRGELLRVVGQALGTDAVPAANTDLGLASASAVARGVDFDSEHRRLLTNKLAEKIEELQREIEERKQADARIRHLNRVHAVLSGINSLVVRVSTRDELCKGACRLAVVQGHFRMAWIGMVDQATGVIAPVAWSGEAAELQKSIRISATGSPEADGLIGTAVLSRIPQLCNDLRNPAASMAYREELVAHGYRSILALPLVVSDRAAGCLLLVSEEAGFFDAEEMRLLGDLARDLSFALDHIEKSERLSYLAYYDPITGLANRALFHERLAQECSAAHRDEAKFTLLLVNINRFEAIGNSLGREVADRLLRQVAERLAQCVGTAIAVARIAGDTFALMLRGAGSAGDVLRELEGWWQPWLGAPFQAGHSELTLAARAGAAFYPADGGDADTLLANADAALSQARSSGDRLAFYNAQQARGSGARLSLETKLRRALEREEFELHYQPKVDLDARRLKGVEALIRWRNTGVGLVPPNDFVPLLEETGLICEVGAWVMRKAAADRTRWNKMGLPAPHVAVNVSPVQLRREDFVAMVTEVAESAGGGAGLDIEVTESIVMEDAARNIAKLHAVRELGMHIAIDDFGIGYSSLAYLVKLPVSSLKIDRAFTSTMLGDAGVMTLVSTMISLAHSLQLEVVAEGVEREEEAAVLRMLRCDLMQGYLISKPLPFDQMAAYLDREAAQAAVAGEAHV